VRLAGALAAAVVAATLVDDLVAPSRLSHPRPWAVLAGALVLAAALLALAPRAGSFAVTVGAGIAAGGALATLLGGIAWRDGVPNPLVANGVAFNLADVAIAVGDALLIGGAVVHAFRHRDRLGAAV
jgi:lipoprotein signal peptidase